MKILTKGILSLLIILTQTSCISDLIHESHQTDRMASFKASVDCPETRTTLDGKQSKWEGEERIQVVGKSGSYEFVASTSTPSLHATFTYNGEFTEDEVFAVYPAGASDYSADFGKMSISGVKIPSEQKATSGSYDKDAAVALAYTTDDELKFKNVVSLLKFTMGSNGIKNVTVWGEMSEIEGDDVPDFVQEGNIYLTIDQQWLSDGARCAAYFWGGSGVQWESMTKVNGQTNMYTCPIPAGQKNVIFCRMNGSTSSNSWDNKWNQTVDLSLSDGTHFTITSPWSEKATGSWSTFGGVTTAGISGTGTIYYNNGAPVFKGASKGYVSLNGDFQKGQTYYIAAAPVVFEKGITVELSTEGDHSKFAVKRSSNKVEFKRNTIYDLGVLHSTKETGFYTDPIFPDADEPCTIYYRPAADDKLYSQTGDLYAHVWLRTGGKSEYESAWGDNSERYKLTKVADQQLWKMTMTPSIREWFGSGTSACQRIGILARTADKSIQTDDYFIKVTDNRYGIDDMPKGLEHGINYIDNSTVTLVLYDRDTKGSNHDFCNLLWDEYWWGYSGKPVYPLNYDDE